MLVLTYSLVFAEDRQNRVSASGKIFTLILMNQTEFDDFILARVKYDNRYNRSISGDILDGLTLIYTKKNFIGRQKPFAWDVYLPVNEGGEYDQGTYNHEVYYHIDNNIHHPIPK